MILDWVKCILPLNGDFINENASVANLDPTPRIESVHKSQIAVVVLVECWIETVYYYVNGKTLDQLYNIYATCFTKRGCMAYVTHKLDMQSIRACKHSRKIIRYCCDCETTEFLVGEMCYFMVYSWRLQFHGLSLRFWLNNLNSSASNLNLHSQS